MSNNKAILDTIVSNLNQIIDHEDRAMVLPWFASSLCYSQAGGYLYAQRRIEDVANEMGKLNPESEEHHDLEDKLLQLEQMSEDYLDMYAYFEEYAPRKKGKSTVSGEAMFDFAFRKSNPKLIETDLDAADVERKLERTAKRKGRTLEQHKKRMSRAIERTNERIKQEASFVSAWNRKHEESLIRAIDNAAAVGSKAGDLNDHHMERILKKMASKAQDYLDTLDDMALNLDGRYSKDLSRAADINVDLYEPVVAYIEQMYDTARKVSEGQGPEMDETMTSQKRAI